MRNLKQLDKYRIPSSYGMDDKGGTFLIQYKNITLKVIASNDAGWDHVSVSLENRTPSWEEMDYIKRMFFRQDEMAIQYHMPSKDHINIHPNCLHLWRPHMPKIILVPPKTLV